LYLTPWIGPFPHSWHTRDMADSFSSGDSERALIRSPEAKARGKRAGAHINKQIETKNFIRNGR
jgi:hypothetical protein